MLGGGVIFSKGLLALWRLAVLAILVALLLPSYATFGLQLTDKVDVTEALIGTDWDVSVETAKTQWPSSYDWVSTPETKCIGTPE